MRANADVHEIVNRFNGAEAVWRCFEQKRAVRRLSKQGAQLPKKSSRQSIGWQPNANVARDVRLGGTPNDISAGRRSIFAGRTVHLFTAWRKGDARFRSGSCLWRIHQCAKSSSSTK